MNAKTTAQPDVLQILAQFERNDGYRLDGSAPRDWALAAYNALRVLSAGAATVTQPTKEQAYDMGAKGAPATDAERLLFEAWMRGHCWTLCATWDGKGYRSDAEQSGNIDPRAMNTRQLWAAWRDRAALTAPQPAVAAGWVMVPVEFVRGFNTLAHNYSLQAVPPDYYHGTEGDAFRAAYRRCGQDLAKLRATLPPAPSTEGESNG